MTDNIQCLQLARKTKTTHWEKCQRIWVGNSQKRKCKWLKITWHHVQSSRTGKTNENNSYHFILIRMIKLSEGINTTKAMRKSDFKHC